MKYIGWFSCGVTSAVACKIAIDRFSNDVDLWYIETGASHDDNKRFIRDCEQWYGRKIKIAKHHKFNNPLEVAEKELFNTPYGAPCTKYLKKQVRQQIEKEYDEPVHVFGFEYLKKEVNRAIRWKEQNSKNAYYPLIEKRLNKEDCFMILKQQNIEIPEMYKLGYNNNNCIGCFKGGMGYWNKIKLDFPEYFQKVSDLEVKTKHTCLKRDKKQLYLKDLKPEDGNHKSINIPEYDLVCELEIEGLKEHIKDELADKLKWNGSVADD